MRHETSIADAQTNQPRQQRAMISKAALCGTFGFSSWIGAASWQNVTRENVVKRKRGNEGMLFAYGLNRLGHDLRQEGDLTRAGIEKVRWHD